MAKEPTNIATKPAKKERSKILYCDFCGKSQHEIQKLIAGRKGFICDECVELCVDIVVQEGVSPGGGTQIGPFRRYVLTVRFDKSFSPQETKMLPAILQTIENAYPGCRISISSFVVRSIGGILRINFDSPIVISDSDISKLESEIEDTSRQLKIAQERYFAEKSEKERFEKMYKELVQDVFPILVDELRKKGKIGGFNTKTLLVMFADIVGFSKMAIEERQQKVDLMRLIGRSILKSEKGMYINTWGDGVIAGFDDPTQGLRCACKFVSHLDVDGVEVRVGVNWGVARITYNEITERTDIDGESVNVGARIEPLAQPGEVLASDVVCGLEELEKSDFLFTEKTIELRKSVGGTEAGDKIKVHSIKYYPNK